VVKLFGLTVNRHPPAYLDSALSFRIPKCVVGSTGGLVVGVTNLRRATWGGLVVTQTGLTRHSPTARGGAAGQFLDAHEHAFEHLGGHTREHLYDRPRTACTGGVDGKVLWNSTLVVSLVS
jgi:hypothetical protein